MRNVIQLGLYKSAEWAYLTKPDWIERMPEQRKEHQLPTFFTENPEPFSYYGVDISLSSICEVRERYKEFPNTYFLACGINNDFSIQDTPNRYYSDEETGKWYNYIHEKDNTLFVSVPFSFLLNNLELESLSVLALDIDGYELEALSTISNWEILPEFITIETNLLYPEPFEHILSKFGYEKIEAFPQYSPEEYTNSDTGEINKVLKNMQETRFLRKDFIPNQRIQGEK